MLILAQSKKWDWSGEVGGVGGSGICTAGSGKATGAEPGRALRDSNSKFHPEQGVKKGDGAHETFRSGFFPVFFDFFIKINI